MVLWALFVVGTIVVGTIKAELLLELPIPDVRR